MSLYQRLDQALKEALKSQQPVAASTLRMLKSAIRYREVELKRSLIRSRTARRGRHPGQSNVGKP